MSATSTEYPDAYWIDRLEQVVPKLAVRRITRTDPRSGTTTELDPQPELQAAADEGYAILRHLALRYAAMTPADQRRCAQASQRYAHAVAPISDNGERWAQIGSALHAWNGRQP